MSPEQSGFGQWWASCPGFYSLSPQPFTKDQPVIWDSILAAKNTLTGLGSFLFCGHHGPVVSLKNPWLERDGVAQLALDLNLSPSSSCQSKLLGTCRFPSSTNILPLPSTLHCASWQKIESHSFMIEKQTAQVRILIINCVTSDKLPSVCLRFSHLWDGRWQLYLHPVVKRIKWISICKALSTVPAI